MRKAIDIVELNEVRLLRLKGFGWIRIMHHFGDKHNFKYYERRYSYLPKGKPVVERKTEIAEMSEKERAKINALFVPAPVIQKNRKPLIVKKRKYRFNPWLAEPK